MVDHYILLKILESQFGVTDMVPKWFNDYPRPRSFKVCIKYSESQQLNFSVQQGSGSGANIFTCYYALINNVVPGSLSINCSPDDHFLQKTFKARNKKQETTTKQLLEDASNRVKDWMDKM